MLKFLKPADAPVVEALEKYELIFAKDQTESYIPLRALPGHTPERPVLTRWALTDEDRAAIAGGAEIYLELLIFNHPLTPVRLAVGKDVDPDYIREQYALPD